MPSYSSHLIVNFSLLGALFVIYQFAGSPLTTLQLALFLVFYILGSVIITPDLDSKSEASRRCGVACVPYRKLFKHRGLSHHPLWGIASRILYVALLAFIVLWLAWLFGWRFEIDGGSALTFIRMYVKEIGAGAAGLFLANLFHIILDRLL